MALLTVPGGAPSSAHVEDVADDVSDLVPRHRGAGGSQGVDGDDLISPLRRPFIGRHVAGITRRGKALRPPA